MKRHIFILALFASLFSACIIDSADTPNLGFLDNVIENEVSTKLEFPMVMAETALSVVAYDAMPAEEKVEMGYIYRMMIKEGENRYKMDRFHGFDLHTMGRSLDEPGAEWVFTAVNASFDFYFGQGRYYLSKAASGDEYKLVCAVDDRESYEILFRAVEDEEAYYSWEIEMDCTYETEEGRVVNMSTDAPLVRKVYRKGTVSDKAEVMMKGSVTVDIKDHDIARHTYDGALVQNPRYDF